MHELIVNTVDCRTKMEQVDWRTKMEQVDWRTKMEQYYLHVYLLLSFVSHTCLENHF
jgi:hypothetical protein